MIRVDGTAHTVVPATDRGLAYGDGVFRTLTAVAGRARHWPFQYERLSADCRALDLPVPDRPFLEREIALVSAESARCVVKITVTCGSGERGYRRPDAPKTTVIVASSSFPDYPAPCRTAGVAVHACRTRLALQPALAGIKHLNRLENVLARNEWNDSDVREGLMRDTEDRLVCGTMSNVFLVEGDRLVTPALDRCGVAGATRAALLAMARRHGREVVIEDVAWDRALRATAVLLTNSVIGVWPVRRIGDRAFAGGAIADELNRWLDEADETA